MRESVIISAVRTPIGRYMGILKEVPDYDLAALVLNDAITSIVWKKGTIRYNTFSIRAFSQI